MPDTHDPEPPAAARRSVRIGTAITAWVIALIVGYLASIMPGVVQTIHKASDSAAQRRSAGIESLALLYSVDVPNDQARLLPTILYQHAKMALIVEGQRRDDCVVTLVDLSPIRDAASCGGVLLVYR